jgi:hypothetical protein
MRGDHIMNLILTPDEVSALESAIEHAQDDHRHYMKYGNPEQDYLGSEADLEEYKRYPERWDAILEKLRTA